MTKASTDRQLVYAERTRQNRRRRRLYRTMMTLFTVFALVFLGAAGGILLQLRQDLHDAQIYSGLSELVTDPVPSDETIPGDESVSRPTQGHLPDDTGEPEILPRYQTVYGMNNDLFGWISVEGTTLNYPVVHTPEDEEYYLRRGFDREYSRSGVPFLDADCKTGCGNYIIYGHNMNNGTMFAPMIAYEEQAFWEAHPVIRFDTLYEKGTYEVVAAFYSRVFYKYETNVFRYYNYHDLTDPEVFQEYVRSVKEKSIYDTGIHPEPGDQLITLITCSYGMKNERFVVVARKQS